MNPLRAVPSLTSLHINCPLDTSVREKEWRWGFASSRDLSRYPHRPGDGKYGAHTRGWRRISRPTNLRPSPTNPSYHRKLHVFQILKSGTREGDREAVPCPD